MFKCKRILSFSRFQRAYCQLVITVAFISMILNLLSCYFLIRKKEVMTNEVLMARSKT